MLISLVWAPDVVTEYAHEKLLTFVTLTAIAVFAPFFIFESARDFRLAVGSLVILAILAAVVATVFPAAGGPSDRLLISGGDSISSGRIAGCAALAVFFLSQGGRFGRAAAVGGFIGLAALTASTGTRGAVVALVLAFAAAYFAHIALSPNRALLAVCVVSVVPVIAWVSGAVALPVLATERVSESLTAPAQTLNENARAQYYARALNLIEESPVRGHGVAAFQQESVLLRDRPRYPHNVFLEIWVELGLIPLVVFIGALGATLATLYIRALGERGGQLRSVILGVFGLFVFALVSAQFSSDINGNRVFWATFGLAWLVASYGVAGPKGRGAGGF